MSIASVRLVYYVSVFFCLICSQIIAAETDSNETDSTLEDTSGVGLESVSPVKIGRAVSVDLLEAQPTFAFADGRGLPAGSGLAADGAVIYKADCASCHGDSGQGGAALELVGDRALLATEFPDKGIAVYWPYAPPLFDYIQRSMPPDSPYSLTADQTYAVIAHLLTLGDLISAEQTVDAKFLSTLVMPNREGFHSLLPE